MRLEEGAAHNERESFVSDERPVEVALKSNDGKEVTGQYGDQVLYTLTDGRVMYVPPIVKKKIDDAGISKGELFTITKAEKKNGTRRTIEWVIGTNGDVPSKSATQTKAPSSGPARPAGNSAGGSATQGSSNGRRTIPPGDPERLSRNRTGPVSSAGFLSRR
jgi:hypothetical protein